MGYTPLPSKRLTSAGTSAPACLTYRALSKARVAPTTLCHAVNINEVVMGTNSQKAAICEEESDVFNQGRSKSYSRPNGVVMTSVCD